MNRRRAAGVVALCVPLVTAGCDDSVLTGPPELRLGRDECAECGMLVNDERCAAVLLVESPPGSGRRRHLVYDDIGCLLDAESKRPAEFGVIERYFKDYASHAWVRAEAASCVNASADTLPTPMGSGMVAFGSAPGAEAAARQSRGVVTDYAGLVAIRREWASSRGRVPSTPR